MLTNFYYLMPAFLLAASAVADWATYPMVSKSASINGFADPIYDLLPECAKGCVKLSTRNTPCPLWDTGCYCVMPQWSGEVGKCIAENCKGGDVVSAESLATSLCSKVGANKWVIPASISTALSKAGGNVKAVPASATIDAVYVTSQPDSTETTGNHHYHSNSHNEHTDSHSHDHTENHSYDHNENHSHNHTENHSHDHTETENHSYNHSGYSSFYHYHSHTHEHSGYSQQASSVTAATSVVTTPVITDTPTSDASSSTASPSSSITTSSKNQAVNRFSLSISGILISFIFTLTDI